MSKNFLPTLIEIKESDGSFSINWHEFPSLLELLFGFAALCALWSYITTGRWY